MPTPRTPRGTPRGAPKVDVYSPTAWAGPKVTQLYDAASLLAPSEELQHVALAPPEMAPVSYTHLTLPTKA